MFDYYAGIGSRKTPQDILNFMSYTSYNLEVKGYVLRSGGAEGADTAFESGVSSLKEIYRPKDATLESISLASKFHPAWNYCNDYIKKLHGRNAQIILGKYLNIFVKFVVCWSSNENYGGTGIAIKIAKSNNIPVYNLFFKEQRKEFERILWN